MERNKGGTAGVLVWTPAPVYSSPSSPEGSDYSWNDEAEEDFQSQMDENGIIGLAESQGQLEVEHREEEMADDMLWDVKTPEPEDGPPPSALEEISCHLSELLDSEPFSQPTYMQEQIADDDQSVLLEDWTDDENEDARMPTIHIEEFNSFPERDRTLDMTDEDLEENDTSEDIQRHTDQPCPVTEEIAPHIDRIKGLDFSNRRNEDSQNISDLEIPEHLEESDCEVLKKSRVRFPPTTLFSSPNTLHTFPHLTSEKQICNWAVDAETFPDRALPSSRVESSLSSHQNSASKTVISKEEGLKPKVTPQTLAKSPVMKSRLEKTIHDGMSEKELERSVHTPYHNHQLPSSSPRKTNSDSQEDRQVSSHAQLFSKASISHSNCSPVPVPHRSSAKNNPRMSKTSYTDPDDVRKGQLSHPLPDFSKVEPKVRFPKGGYKPPKSRAVAYSKTSHTDLPIVFKSPAEIVREVLLSSTDEPPESPTSRKHLNSTVPEEFRCPQQASTLVQQLQEDYNRLLTKYADAENTIDRLRLEAKVGLYSDSPKPSTAILSGVIQEGSKVMTLSFPQAQRVVFGADSANVTLQRDNSENSKKAPTRPSSVNSVSSRWSGSIGVTAEHLTETLTNQTCRFQLQVDSFEQLLKNGKLKPCEQFKGLSTLAEGQESLERAYLDARAQFQMLQQRQSRPLTFDPDRELEGQIFKSGMRLEELRERVKQNQPTFEPPSTPPPQSDMLSLSMLETEPLPESPLAATHPEACVGVEVSSVSGESDEDREEEEEMLPSHLHPLYDKHQRVEKDFGNLIDCYQSFKELPKLMDRSITLMSCDSVDFEDSFSTRNGCLKDRQRHRATTEREKTISARTQPAADFGPPSGPSVRSQVCDAVETRPKALCHSSLLPGRPGRKAKTAGNRKDLSRSLTSLPESTETGNMLLKAKPKTVVAPPLDGVVSPETDSGFIGSDSSRLTPAVHSPLQQRTVVSCMKPSGPDIKDTVKPDSAPPTRQTLVFNPSRSRPFTNHPAENISTGGCPGSVRRRESEERCSASSLATSASPLHWPETPLQPWPTNLTSQSENWSDQGEEKAQEKPYPQTAHQQLCFQRGHSRRVPHHHGDLKAQSSVQLTNHQEAFQSLQQEVNKLKERLEGSLSVSKPAIPVRVPSTLTKDSRNHTFPQTATPQWLDLRTLERKGGHMQMRRNKETEENLRGSTSRPAPRKRSASLPRNRSESNTTSDSERVQSEPRSSTFSYIPVSPTTSRERRQIRSRFGPHTDCNTQHNSTSEGGSDDNDETEPSRVPDLTCPHCMSKRTAASARTVRSSPRHAQSHCSHCPLCGASQFSQSRIPQSENQESVHTLRWSQPMRASQRNRVGVNIPVAPPLTAMGSVPVVPYVPVYPSTFYLSSPVATQAHSQSFNILPSPSRDERSEVRGHRRRSLSMDLEESSLSSSLTRAISVARNMRRVSRHMTHSLASGLENMSYLAMTY
ncbi:microtubule organization protein AKNA isoform X2 [Misgurnus anguillicaudatus]|uniref:microtubule organization protein AKNA isoform X2 n=1 Tax=Misgurnus anguillicaudatus TaxID=75329 RepID=UPI003CCF8D6D